MSVRAAHLLSLTTHPACVSAYLLPSPLSLARPRLRSLVRSVTPFPPPNNLENSADYEQRSTKRPEPATLNDSQHFRSRLPRRRQRSQPRFPSPPLLAATQASSVKKFHDLRTHRHPPPHVSFRLLSTLMYVTLAIRPCCAFFFAHEFSLRYAKDRL
jgi:hypothetical protein